MEAFLFWDVVATLRKGFVFLFDLHVKEWNPRLPFVFNLKNNCSFHISCFFTFFYIFCFNAFLMKKTNKIFSFVFAAGFVSPSTHSQKYDPENQNLNIKTVENFCSNHQNAKMDKKSFLAFFVAVIVAGAQGLCPDNCTCDDVNLIVTCIRAGLEVMPNTLNPRLQTIIYKYNNFPMIDVSLRWEKLDFHFSLKIWLN